MPTSESGHWTLVESHRVDESGTVRLEITRRAELAVRAMVALAELELRRVLGAVTVASLVEHAGGAAAVAVLTR